MNFLGKLARVFTSYRPDPLPEFPPIELNTIPKASILLFYGGPAITEVVGNYVYKHPYTPAAFHAGGYLGQGEFLNIGLEAEIQNVKDEYRSTRRIDVVVLEDLTDDEREIICKKFRRDASHNFYDAIGFVRFGSKLKVLRFLKNIKSSRKNDFCSDNVVDNFSEPPIKRPGDTDQEIKELTLSRKIEVSNFPSEDTAPWHLAEHAYSHPSVRKVYTLWPGLEFEAG